MEYHLLKRPRVVIHDTTWITSNISEQTLVEKSQMPTTTYYMIALHKIQKM